LEPTQRLRKLEPRKQRRNTLSLIRRHARQKTQNGGPSITIDANNKTRAETDRKVLKNEQKKKEEEEKKLQAAARRAELKALEAKENAEIDKTAKKPIVSAKVAFAHQSDGSLNHVADDTSRDRRHERKGSQEESYRGEEEVKRRRRRRKGDRAQHQPHHP
jgi:hypothetical protein